MAYCQKCGTEVKEEYNLCPNCGNNLKQIIPQKTSSSNNKLNSQTSAVVIIIMIVFIIPFILLDDNSSESNEYDTSKIYNVGEKLTCPYFDVTVDNVQIKQKGTKIDNYQVIDDPEWIGVTLTVTNTSSENHIFSTSKINLVNTNGEVLEHNWLTYKIWGVEILNSPELISGGTKTGYIQYSNPSTDNSNLTLLIDCSAGIFEEEVIYKINVSQ